jgi:Cu+-exporting ATPase
MGKLSRGSEYFECENMKNNTIELKVEGMDCANCAMSITRFLERKNLEDVYVNFSTKEVRFRMGHTDMTLEQVKAGINKLGYTVVEEAQTEPWWTLERKLLISALFTAPLLLHHLLMVLGGGIPGFENPWLQLLVCLPPFAIGFLHFGRSALSSLRGGVPNMDVLIFTGSTAAFIYSLIGTLLMEPNYIFYETAATIITLVLVGNWLEKRAVDQTTSAIGELTRLQVEQARRIMPSGTVVRIDKDEIKAGHILQVNEGDKVPADGHLTEGSATVDESMLTGESAPVEKEVGDEVIGASLVRSGNFQMEVTAAGRDSVLSQMIELIKTAQRDKPRIQRLADKISAIFVPVVLGIAALAFSIGHWGFGLSTQQALMNAIAVLVISCPCAMGLATPTAVMVGVGRMARNGILVKGGQTLEIFSKIKQMVFDKTGTLTTGEFKIKDIEYHTTEKKRVNALIYTLERHSSHPIAQSLVREMAHRLNGEELGALEVTEEKGIGVVARDAEGNAYKIGSERIFPNASGEERQMVYLMKNGDLLAAVEIADDIKPEAQETIRFLKKRGINPVVLSGDRREKTEEVARRLGIDEFYAEQLPADKLEVIEALSQEAPTAMVGDGINDAPALAKATLGVSLSDASPAAIRSAQIVLLNGNLQHLRRAVGISRHTVLTIKQNLFWAFAYNIVAIPVAAVGLLNPMLGALFMAFSDVVVIGNSIRLKYKRIKD